MGVALFEGLIKYFSRDIKQARILAVCIRGEAREIHLELISAEVVFRAMGPNDITWGVNMRFMKCFGIRNSFLYQRLGATALDNNYYAFTVWRG